jgi:hypothetical protein
LGSKALKVMNIGLNSQNYLLSVWFANMIQTQGL